MLDRITPVNRALLLANIGVFLLQLATGGAFDDYLALWPPQSVNYGGAPSTIRTFTFGG